MQSRTGVDGRAGAGAEEDGGGKGPFSFARDLVQIIEYPLLDVAGDGHEPLFFGYAPGLWRV